eukprot:GHVP01068907.1.p1 GENE.GHVP01068907.1~~GHVP01068907.1.p1  ORF type:complete len:341 (-),score=75.19 GHVP01068907.1:70-1092(-)
MLSPEKEAYAIAFAPLSRESMIDELADEQVMDAFDKDLWLDEFRYLKELVCYSFENMQVLINSENKKTATLGLICGGQFLGRVSEICNLLSITASSVAQSNKKSVLPVIKKFSKEDEESFIVSTSSELQALVDFTKARKWRSPHELHIQKDKEVEFAEESEFFSFEKRQSTIAEVIEPKRSTRRKSTGYPGKKEEGPPVVSPGSPKPIYSKHAVAIIGSVAEEAPLVEEAPMGDPLWEESDRHERRFSRIRQRIPTGHPSTLHLRTREMSLNSDEEGSVGEIIKEYSRRSTAEISDMMDEATLENTAANSVCQTNSASAPSTVRRGVKEFGDTESAVSEE